MQNNTYADVSKIPAGFSKEDSFMVSGGSIVNGIEVKSELQTKELTKKVNIILKKLGYQVANCLQDAKYCILFNYGLTSESKILNTTKYIPGTSVTTTGSLNGIYGYYGQYKEQSQSSGTYILVPEEYTFYTKFLSFHVYDANAMHIALEDAKNSELKLPPVIWHGFTQNIDQGADLRLYLDFLCISLCNLIGKNTPGTINTYIYEDDEVIIWLRNTYLNKE
jgi:hypothetical protein